MSRMKKYALAGGTFAVAMGIGFVMQNGDALAARFSGEGEADVAVRAAGLAPASGIQPGAQPAADPAPEAGILLAAAPVPDQPTGEEIAAATMEPPAAEIPLIEVNLEGEPVLESMAEPASAGADTACDISLLAKPAEAAMVTVALHAPCQPSTRVTLYHQGLIFSDITDADGFFAAEVPALAERAVFVAALADGEGALAETQIPDLAMYERAVLQWQGTRGLGLHALEGNADYGSEGHVWSGAARDASAAADGLGFLTRLGNAETDAPFQAEIYSIPRDASEVWLSIEAEVMDQNCGQPVGAQTLQFNSNGRLEARDLEMTLPGCEAVGDFLVLHNMLEDLTLASR